MGSRRIVTMLAVAVLAPPLLSACTVRGTFPSGTVMRGTAESTPTVSASPEVEWGTATTKAYSGARRLEVTMRVQRLAPGTTGAPDAYAEIAGGSADALIQVNPLWSLAAITQTGTVGLAGDGAPAFTTDGSPLRNSGFSARRKFKLPLGTTDLVLTVHLGPSCDLAAEGVELRLPVADIPVVTDLSVPTTPTGPGMPQSF